jgi:hypothetical protein
MSSLEDHRFLDRMQSERTPDEFARAILEHRDADGTLQWARQRLGGAHHDHHQKRSRHATHRT